MRYYAETVVKPAITGLFLGSVAIGILFIYGLGIERFKPEIVRDLLLALGGWSPLIYIVCNVVRPFFFFPAAVLAVAGGLAFGPFWGTVYLVTGTVLGAVSCFCLARIMGDDRIRHVLPKWTQMSCLGRRAATYNFKAILILRLVPILPWDVVSFLSGLSKAPFWSYCIATFIGSIPGAIAFCYLGTNLWRPLSTAFLVAVVICMAVCCLPLIYWGRRNSENNHRSVPQMAKRRV